MTEHLRESDRVDVAVLVDNYIDLFVPPAMAGDHRPPFSPARPLLAEHGLSCLVTVFSGGREHRVLMDAGLSPGCDLGDVESVVLSHGHFDHTGGLCDLFRGGNKQISLVIHPDAFLHRRMNNPAQGPVELPRLDAVSLKKAGASVKPRKNASTVAAGHLLVTGEIERKTGFEKGLPWAEANIGDRWIADPIRDDQGLVISVNGKGLVVISGCAHAGIINTVEYARKITGIDTVHAVIGGFHLTGPFFEPVIQPTIDAMKEIGPEYVIPLHCTGWKAINRFAEEMPGQFILNTVDTTYTF